MTIENLYQIYLQHPVISTDTRKIAPRSLFFALKGDKFDANTFAKQALEAGAAYAIIDAAEYALSDRYVLVDDVLDTLQELARYHRRQLNIPVIGLTGTNGKTTTKELIHAVLSTRFATLATQGNLNNHIGVPLTLLSINSSHQIAVIEMGANHQKEIALLCTIAEPTHGLITNVGKAHLEGFGGVEGVKKGKGELYDYLAVNNGTIFINSSNPDLMEMLQARKPQNVVTYSVNENGFISGELMGNAPYLSLTWRQDSLDQPYEVSTQLTGAYNLDNVLAAISIGRYFNIEAGNINKGLEGYQPTNNRSQIIKTESNTLICDYYNANPSSMAVAIDNLSKIEATHKVLILGDMFEMGEEAAVEHRAIIQKALAAQADDKIFIGAEFFAQKESDNGTFYGTAEDAIEALKSNPIRNATILIKGSRGMALERLVALL